MLDKTILSNMAGEHETTPEPGSTGDLVRNELDRPEFAEGLTSLNFQSEREREMFGLISRTVHAYGPLREWPGAARFNLIADLVGSLSYRSPEYPDMREQSVEATTGFKLAVIFTGFADEDGYVSPDLHEERERWAEEFGENNVLSSFFTGDDGRVQLGLFIRRQTGEVTDEQLDAAIDARVAQTHADTETTTPKLRSRIDHETADAQSRREAEYTDVQNYEQRRARMLRPSWGQVALGRSTSMGDELLERMQDPKNTEIVDRVFRRGVTPHDEAGVEASDQFGYWERKGGIITAMLDEISPITDDMPEETAQRIDIERQSLAMRAGWNQMEPEELEAMWLETHDSLPYDSTQPDSSTDAGSTPTE